MVLASDFQYKLSETSTDYIDKERKSRSDVLLMVANRRTEQIEQVKFEDIVDILKGYHCIANEASYGGKVPGSMKYFQPLYANEKFRTWAIPSSGTPFEKWMIDQLKFSFVRLSTPRASIDHEKMFADNKSLVEYWEVNEDFEDKDYAVIGTTALKVLQSWNCDKTKKRGDSNILITPGFEFRNTKALLTNFHFPGETNLAMTCAFGGTDFILHAHQEAANLGYRISNYGDRLLII